MKKHIENIMKQENITDNKLDLEAYSFDGSGIKGNAKIVIFPKETLQIQKIIQYCNRINTPVIVRGFGTNNVGSAVPEDAVVIDMTRMSTIKKYDPKLKEITVDAGTSAQDLNNYISYEGLEYPFADEFSSTSSIGAQVSYNQLALKSGDGRIEEWIKEIEIVDGTGKDHIITKFKDFLGAEGSLGVITKIRLKLKKIRENISSDLMEFSEKPKLLAKTRDLNFQKEVSAIEFFDKESSMRLGLEPKYHLFVEYNDKRGSRDEEKTQNIWNKRLRLNSYLRQQKHFFLEDPKLSLEKIYDLIEWSEKHGLVCYGPIATGTIFVSFPYNRSQLLKEYYTSLRYMNAKFSSTWGYGLKKKQYVPPGYKHKFIKLKDQYDYNNIMNRNKLVNFR